MGCHRRAPNRPRSWGKEHQGCGPQVGLNAPGLSRRQTFAVDAGSSAEMERDLLIERTQAGLTRAKAEGKKLGRPSKITSEQRSDILRLVAEGASISALARKYAVSRATIAGLKPIRHIRKTAGSQYGVINCCYVFCEETHGSK